MLPEHEIGKNIRMIRKLKEKKGSNLLLTLAQFKLHGFNVLFDSLILYHVRFYLSVNKANCASRVKSRFDPFTLLNFHRPDPKNGFEILRKIGGYEIGGIAGAILAAASKSVAIVLDGVISTAAGLIAYQINPHIGGYLIAGHRSVEVAQKAALHHIKLEPVIDLNMRLGEGTGAALTMDIVDAACRIMREMASFEEAGVSKK